jgi:lysophospholipase L1-like esterase
MKNCFLFIFFFLFLPAQAQKESGNFIPARDANYAYIGRFDLSDKDKPVFMYSGCRIRTVFEGTSVELDMKDDSLRNLFTIVVDKKITVLKANRKDGRYLLADHLENGKHNLDIVRRTEWHGGNTVFLGLKLDKGMTIFKPEIKERRIEFIGDSYTCGYGNEGKSRKEHFTYETENNYLTYGAIAARTLDAEYFMICRSGIGMYQGYGGNPDFNMPKYYDEIVLHGNHSWDFSQYQPQLVVIDLGGNDLSAKLDSVKFVRSYVDFLARIRKNYPSSRIICVAGPSVYGDEWQNWRSLIHTVVNQVKPDDPGVSYFEFSTFEPDGSDWHPNVEQHNLMAEELEPFLEALMDW